jgi:adenylate cyclase
MAEAKRRLAAILAADVAGYSRLMGDDEGATLETLDACRNVFSVHILSHDGRLVDTAGDSVLAVFDSVVEAVGCATAVQNELAGRNAALAVNRQMHFRVGVNLGDVIAKDDGTIYGNGVNVAARLEGLAEPGGIALSEDAYRQIEAKMALDFTDIGEHDVKNIARPVRAYRTGRGNADAAPARTRLSLPDKPSIAVLAFDNLGGDIEQEYFADGISEDLITALSRIRWLFVTARNSSFAYKGMSPDVRKVGEELGVRYVLEGSVRKGGNRVRVTAQLIEAMTGNQVWAERHDRELTDLFDLQDEITEAIVAAVGPELDARERELARRKPPESLDAWDNYQRGLWSLYQFTKDGNREARQCFGRAIEIDPSFASAYAAMAYAHGLAVNQGFTEDRTESVKQARHAAQKAVAADEKDAFGHTVLARAYTYAGEDQAAIKQIQTAIGLNPNFALAYHVLALAMVAVNNPDESISAANTASRLSPHDPMYAFYDAVRSIACFLSRDYEQAVEWAESGTRRPKLVGFWPCALLASALALLGRNEEAKRALDEARRHEPKLSLDFVRRAVWWHHDQLENLFEGLQMAGLDIAEAPAAAD